MKNADTTTAKQKIKIMRKRIKIFSTLLLLLSLTACRSSNDNKKIEETITSFYKGLYNLNFETIKANSTEESAELLGYFENFSKHGDLQIPNMPKIEVKHIEIIDDTIAIADVKADDNSKLKLKKRNDKWLVAFDMESLSEMYRMQGVDDYHNQNETSPYQEQSTTDSVL